MKVCNSKNTGSSKHVVSGVHTISCYRSLISSSIGKPTIEISSITKTFKFCKRNLMVDNLSCDTDDFDARFFEDLPVIDNA